MTKLSGIIEVDYIPSVNSMYEANFSGGKYRGFKLTDLARDYKDSIKSQLESINLVIPEDYNPNYPIIVSIIFIINSNLLKRDLDNMEKLTIDAIFEHLNLNDKYIFEKHTFKLYAETNHEYIRYVIEQGNKSIESYKYTISKFADII